MVESFSVQMFQKADPGYQLYRLVIVVGDQSNELRIDFVIFGVSGDRSGDPRSGDPGGDGVRSDPIPLGDSRTRRWMMDDG